MNFIKKYRYYIFLSITLILLRLIKEETGLAFGFIPLFIIFILVEIIAKNKIKTEEVLEKTEPKKKSSSKILFTFLLIIVVIIILIINANIPTKKFEQTNEDNNGSFLLNHEKDNEIAYGSFNKAKEEFGNNNYNDALISIEEAIALNPLDSNFYFLKIEIIKKINEISDELKLKNELTYVNTVSIFNENDENFISIDVYPKENFDETIFKSLKKYYTKDDSRYEIPIDLASQYFNLTYFSDLILYNNSEFISSIKLKKIIFIESVEENYYRALFKCTKEVDINQLFKSKGLKYCISAFATSKIIPDFEISITENFNVEEELSSLGNNSEELYSLKNENVYFKRLVRLLDQKYIVLSFNNGENSDDISYIFQKNKNTLDELFSSNSSKDEYQIFSLDVLPILKNNQPILITYIGRNYSSAGYKILLVYDGSKYVQTDYTLKF